MKNKKVTILEAKKICIDYLNEVIKNFNFESSKQKLPCDILNADIFTSKEKLVEYSKIIEDHQKLIKEMIETQKFAKYKLNFNFNKYDFLLEYKDNELNYFFKTCFEENFQFFYGFILTDKELKRDKIILISLYLQYLKNKIDNLIKELEILVELPEKYFLKEN